jgi:hypothetical protein
MVGTLKHKLNLLTYSWRAVGARTLLHNLVRFTADAEARNVDSGFDARFGTDTNAELTPKECMLPEERRGVATMYLPSMDQDLDAMLHGLAWPQRLLAESTFVDIGSGKGRVVFLAGMRRFREVVGVELSPILHRIAINNLGIMRAAQTLASPTRLVHADAADFDVPSGPFIAYLYHPFREAVAELVMARIRAALVEEPRPAAILYGHPTLQRPMDARVFARGDVFRQAVAGERRTRHFRVGWSVWSNDAWLESRYNASLIASAIIRM